MLKRFITFVLCALLVFQLPVTAYAENMSGGLNLGIPVNNAHTNSGNKGTVGITQAYGYRVTMATANPITEAGIAPLEGQYTKDDLTKQFQDIGNIASTRYWEPGNAGIDFLYRGSIGKRETYGTYAAAGMAKTAYAATQAINENAPGASNDTNRLAWLIYESDPNNTTRPSQDTSYAYNAEIYKKVVTDPCSGNSAEQWLADLRAMYNATSGTDDVVAIISNVMTGPQQVNGSLRNFTWASTEYNGTPQQNVRWSNTGYLAACIYLAWYAQSIGNSATYTEFANAIWNWKQSGWSAASMPIITLEATSAVTEDGQPNGPWIMATPPLMLAWTYGADVVEQLYRPWEAATLEEEIALLTKNKTIVVPARKSQMSQGFGRYWENGQPGPPTGSGKDRQYYHSLYPIDGRATEFYGYAPHYTFFVDNPFGIPGDPITGPDPAKGTFTWDLTPKGIIDKTPSEEVNESSTIYNLNVSQNGHNSNNYAEWEKWVLSDGKDCNKIRFNIYHVSEALNKDVPATDYTYGQVKAAGKKVTEAVDRVADRRLS